MERAEFSEALEASEQRAEDLQTESLALQVCVCVASDRAVCCFCAVCAVRMRVYADCTRLRAMICDICCVRMPVFADRTFCVPQSELTALRKQVTSLSAQLQERVARDAVCGGPMSIATWPWGSGWCNRARAARRRGRRLCGRPTRQRVYWMVIGCAAALDPIHTYARKHTHTHTHVHLVGLLSAAARRPTRVGHRCRLGRRLVPPPPLLLRRRLQRRRRHMLHRRPLRVRIHRACSACYSASLCTCVCGYLCLCVVVCACVARARAFTTLSCCDVAWRRCTGGCSRRSGARWTRSL
jgi:hypothetical protein